MTTQPLETVWTALLTDAGYDSDIPCSPNKARLDAYFANVDRLIGERESELRAVCASVKASVSGSDRFYVEGIEAAIDRAIASPRQA